MNRDTLPTPPTVDSRDANGAGDDDLVRRIHVAGHELRVYVSSTPLVRQMVDDIRAARVRVWLESYIFADDEGGRAVARAMAERAAVGVDCRLLYDALGCAGTADGLFYELEQAGVKLHAFHTLWHALSQLAPLRVFNQRNHRKLLVVDHHVAYFGGMNVVDQRALNTIDDLRARHLPPSAAWRDVHIRLEGPQQAEIAEIMDRFWRRTHDKRRRLRQPRWPVGAMLRARDEALFFFDTRPRLRYRRPDRILVPLVRSSRRSIVVAMAYFIPRGALLRALVRARRQGVAVQVVVPGESDVRLVQWATRHMYDRLLRRGIRIYERADQMLHSKVMVIDDAWSVIGSCNLDPRSLRHNFEFLAVIRSAPLTEVLREICRQDMARSRRVTLHHHARRSWWQRRLDRFAWSLRNWL